MKKNGIDVIEGHGVVTDDGNVKVGGNFDGTEIAATIVILATGSVKKPLPGTRFGGRVIGTEEAWALSELPATLAVVGAGASGTEIASAYARLGTRRHALRGPRPRAADRGRRHLEDRRARLQEAGHQGPHRRLRRGRRVRRGRASRFTVAGEPARREWLVIAAGRAPDIEGLGLEEAGIALDRRPARRRRRRDAHVAGRRLRDRRPRPRPGARAQGLRRGHHRRRGRRRPADAPDRVRRHPARDLLLSERRQLRAHRAAGDRRRPRRRRRHAAASAPSARARSTATAPAS